LLLLFVELEDATVGFTVGVAEFTGLAVATGVPVGVDTGVFVATALGDGLAVGAFVGLGVGELTFVDGQSFTLGTGFIGTMPSTYDLPCASLK
jgi:hypothetical protein